MTKWMRVILNTLIIGHHAPYTFLDSTNIPVPTTRESESPLKDGRPQPSKAEIHPLQSLDGLCSSPVARLLFPTSNRRQLEPSRALC